MGKGISLPAESAFNRRGNMNGIKKRYETQKLMIDGKLRDVEIYRVPELLKQVPGADCRECAFFGTMKAYELGLPFC